MRPTTGSAIHGFGMNHGLLEGSWVFGVSLDGETFNDLLILGSFAGVPEDPNPNPSSPPVAFFGQDGYWPDEEFLKEPDVSRMARNVLAYKDEIWKPIPLIKKDEAVKAIICADGSSWDEHDPMYNPTYPWNQVRETPARHTEEWDSTPQNERITLWHGASHSYQDWHQNGDRMVKITGDDFEIVLKNKKLYVSGDLNITAKGSVNILAEAQCNIASIKDMTLSSLTSITIESAGPVKVHSLSSAQVSALGSVAIEALGTASLSCAGNVNVGALGTATVQALGAATLKAGGDCTVEAVGAVSVQAGGMCTVQAVGEVNIQGGALVNVQAVGAITVTAVGSVEIIGATCGITAAVITLTGELILA